MYLLEISYRKMRTQNRPADRTLKKKLEYMILRIHLGCKLETFLRALGIDHNIGNLNCIMNDGMMINKKET